MARPAATTAFLAITACLLGIAPAQAHPEFNSYVDTEKEDGGVFGRLSLDDSDASVVLDRSDSASLHDMAVAQTEFGRLVRVPEPLLPLTSAELRNGPSLTDHLLSQHHDRRSVRLNAAVYI